MKIGSYNDNLICTMYSSKCRNYTMQCQLNCCFDGFGCNFSSCVSNSFMYHWIAFVITLEDVRGRIAHLEDMKNQRLEFLRKNRQYKDTYDAIMWLRENQHKFEKPVNEPIMLLVGDKWHIKKTNFEFIIVVWLLSLLLRISICHPFLAVFLLDMFIYLCINLIFTRSTLNYSIFIC